MSDMMLNLIIVTATGVFIAGLFLFLAIRKRKRQADFEKVAVEHGWHVERLDAPLVSGYLLTGRSGQTPWSLETKAVSSSQEAGPGSAETRHVTRWWCAGLPMPEHTVVIGPHPGGASLANLGAFGGSFLNMGMRAMLGEDADWVGSLTPVELPDQALRDRLLCLATDPQAARRLLSVDATRALLALPGKYKAVVKLHAGELEIRLPGTQLQAGAELAALVALGERMAHAWQN